MKVDLPIPSQLIEIKKLKSPKLICDKENRELKYEKIVKQEAEEMRK